MDTKKKEEILWINTLKGGCIILVVLYHIVLPGYLETLQNLTAGCIPAHFWITFNTLLSPLRMPTFFFVSGLLAANSVTNKPWKAVFSSRVTNLFYLYILWGIIQWASIDIITTDITGQRISQNINASYANSLSEFFSSMLTAMSNSWYLYALGLFFLCCKWFRHQRMALLLVALVLNYAAIADIIPGWGVKSLSQYFIYFFVGVFYSTLIIRLSQWRRENIVPWLILSALSGVHVLLNLDRSFYFCVLVIAICIALVRNLNQYFNMSLLNWLGKNTLQIYVLHRIFIEYFGMTAIMIAQKYQLFHSQLFSRVWAVGFPITMLILCAGCSIGIWLIINRGIGKYLFIYPKLLPVRLSRLK